MESKNLKWCFILIGASLFLSVCSNKKENIEHTLSSVARDNLLIENAQDQINDDIIFVTDRDESDYGLSTWIGKYNYFESFLASSDFGYNQTFVYDIIIYEENTDYFAEINVDGFQTMERLKAKVEGNKEAVNLIFYKYLPENRYELYREGDILLSFRYVNQEVLTYWGEYKSNMYNVNGETGKVYFERY